MKDAIENDRFSMAFLRFSTQLSSWSNARTHAQGPTWVQRFLSPADLFRFDDGSLRCEIQRGEAFAPTG